MSSPKLSFPASLTFCWDLGALVLSKSEDRGAGASGLSLSEFYLSGSGLGIQFALFLTRGEYLSMVHSFYLGEANIDLLVLQNKVVLIAS